MPLAVGTPAPDFTLPLAPGEAPLRLADYKGEKTVVLLFFPLAFSGVCTTEMCTVAEDYGAWSELGAEVIGVSVDSPFVNRKFARECNAPFPIVSDFNKDVITAYDVKCDDYFGLRGVSHRAAFVVDPQGMIVYSWMDEDSSQLPDFEALKAAVAAIGTVRTEP